MKESIANEGEFNTKMSCSDWRFSASIVGMVQYFKYHNIDYYLEDDYILYNYEDIQKDKYLKFVEEQYDGEYLPHKKIEELLKIEILSEDESKLLNESMQKGRAGIKKYLGKFKYPEQSREAILSGINKNRFDMVEKLFIDGDRTYNKFNNNSYFFKETQDSCRLHGFSIDMNRKGKAQGYRFQKSAFHYEDHLEFDFIPFAFTKTNESFFINNNLDVEELLVTFSKLTRTEEPRNALFNSTKESATFIDYDVEVIVKKSKDASFETLFIRKSSIKIFEAFKNYDDIKNKYIKIESDYVNIEEIVTNNILNLLKLDDLLYLLIKKSNMKKVITQLINVNEMIYKGGEKMENKKILSAMYTGMSITEKFKDEDNKINAYKHRLLTAMSVNDYDGFNLLLLKLGSITGVELNFAYELFDNFEENKNIAFSFVNALGKTKTTTGGENNGK